MIYIPKKLTIDKIYSIPYGDEDGLIFESTITDYQSLFEKKGIALIAFKTNSKAYAKKGK